MQGNRRNSQVSPLLFLKLADRHFGSGLCPNLACLP